MRRHCSQNVWRTLFRTNFRIEKLSFIRLSRNTSVRSLIVRALENDKRAGTVGFALTILQRRLASSPEAIYQSLRRRRERLEKRLRELELLQRGGQIDSIAAAEATALDEDDIEDLEDAPKTRLKPPKNRFSIKRRPRAPLGSSEQRSRP